MHMLPGIFRVVVRLADKYGIHAIRIPWEHLRPRIFSPKKMKRLVELMVINTVCLGVMRRSTKLNAKFLGLYDGGHLNLTNLQKVLSELGKPGVYELMCHPGEADEMSMYKHWGYSPEEELAALTAPEIKQIIVDNNIELTTYAALLGDGL